MLKKRTYLYSTEDKWELKWANSFETDEFTGYHAAAAEIARERDNRFCDYPDEQFIWVLDEKHTVPRRFRVDAESVREYSAREVEPAAERATEDKK